MTIRGCAYAGSKGVVWGPIKDMIHISHGPVGCGQYSRAGRRNYYIGTTGVNTFVDHAFHIGLSGKGHRLRRRQEARCKIIDEIEGLFPLNKGITIQSECPIGLIGDDIEAVARSKVQGNRQNHRSGALRRFPRRLPIARPPYRQRLDPRLGFRSRAMRSAKLSRHAL